MLAGVCDKRSEGMERQEKKLKIERFLINLSLNLSALLPAVLFVAAAYLGLDHHIAFILTLVYFAAAATVPMVINIIYCHKNSVHCFVHWWAIMTAVSIVGFFVIFMTASEKLGLEPTGAAAMAVLAIFTAGFIFLESLIYQTVLIIRFLKRKSQPQKAPSDEV